MKKTIMNITVNPTIKSQFEKKVGRGNVSKTIESFMLQKIKGGD